MVFVVHGYDSSPQKNWFVWLQSQLTKAKIPTQILAMPTPQTPNLADWIAHLQQCAPTLGAHDVFVAHSLGCIATLQFLQVARYETLGGIVLVAGFFEPVAGLESLNSFTEPALCFEILRAKIRSRTVLAARDDSIVPFAFTQNLAQNLAADLMIYEKGNHFMDSDGFTRLPIVEFLVRDCLAHGGERV